MKILVASGRIKHRRQISHIKNLTNLMKLSPRHVLVTTSKFCIETPSLFFFFSLLSFLPSQAGKNKYFNGIPTLMGKRPNIDMRDVHNYTRSMCSAHPRLINSGFKVIPCTERTIYISFNYINAMAKKKKFINAMSMLTLL